jgi:hypothetical protein
MKKYIGIKEINAKPMNRLEYNQFRNWELPSDENGKDEGYLVEYINSSTSNTKEYKGYVSWSPKKEFEDSYKIADTFYDRLLIETQELVTKTNTLNNFMRTTKFVNLDREDKKLLYLQSRLMNEYVQVLDKRLELLGKNLNLIN